MKTKIVLLLLILFAFKAANGSPFTVVSESADEIIVEFGLPEWSIGQVDENMQTWQRIVCDAANAFLVEGYPEMVSFSEAIGIPVDGDISIQVLSSKSEVHRGINLFPARKMLVEDYEVRYVFHKDNGVYSRSTLYPQHSAQKGSSAFIGNRRFIPLQLFPFRYNPVTKELHVSSSMRIRVSIQGTKAATKNWQLYENIIDDASDSFFLNNASSKQWRLPKTRDLSYTSPKSTNGRINDLQLVVDSEGIFKVSYHYLNAYINSMIDSLGIEMTWLPSSVDPRFLELRDKNGPVPIHFHGENDGVFNQSDYFEFYGEKNYGKTGNSDAYTAENVYTFGLVDHFGARMAVENGGLTVSNPNLYIVPTAYQQTVHFEEQIVTDKLGRGWTATNPNYYKEDVWFWRKISAPNLDIVPFELEYPVDSTIRTFSTTVALHGLTYNDTLAVGHYDHSAIVRLNQSLINSHTWVGQTEKIFTNASPVPNSFLRHGTNNLYIGLPGDTSMKDREQILLDYLQLNYWRQYRTSKDYLKFTKPSDRPGGLYQFELEGFNSSDISVYKIGASIFNNLQIEPFNLDGMAPWTVTFQDSVATNSIQYYAVTELQKKTPKQIRLDFPSDLRNPTNSGDLVVVTVREFIDAEGTLDLKNVWESVGYTVKIVDIQDIFDEFNHGIRAAQPIQDFIRYAYNNWSSPQIRHVVLLGEGTDDERDNSPNRKYNLIPVKKLWTYKHGATASDPWYGCILGDDIVTDISIARINVWTAEQIKTYANKVYQYHNDPMTSRLWSSHLTLTAGGKISDPNDIFSQQSERIRRKSIPDHYRVSRVYTATQTVSPDYFGGTFALKDAINSGTQFVQFMGHGGGRIWADYNLFNFNDVATLNNQVYPFVVSLACYASAFDTPGAASISEALVTQANRGAISTLGFAGLGYLIEDEDYGLALSDALFKNDLPSVGESVVFASARFYTTSVSPSPMYALTTGSAYLGDPAIKFRKPQINIQVNPERYIYQPGDTLRVTATFPDGVNFARLFVQKDNEKTVNVPFDLPVIQNTFTASYVLPVSAGTDYGRKIYVAGYSSDLEYVGMSRISVGTSNLVHLSMNPTEPTWQDSIRFSAKIFAQQNISSVTCRVLAWASSGANQATWIDLPMQQVGDTDVWQTIGNLVPQRTGREIRYKYVLAENTETYESPLYSVVIAGPDLLLSDIKLVNYGNQLALDVHCKNVGNAASITTDLRLYIKPDGQPTTLYKIQDLPPYGVNEERWETIVLDDLFYTNMSFEVRANWSNAFSEWHIYYNTNNIITLDVPFNYHVVDNNGAVLSSLDQNLACVIPPGLVDVGENALFYIHDLESFLPHEQPDISTIMLGSGISSRAYEVRTLNSSLVDSLGTFANNKKIRLTFQYSSSDSLAQLYESENSYRIFRWDATTRKWILQGGIVSTSENKVVFDVSKQGIYSLFRNRDRIRPSIDVNVQDQEFTVGGYISGKGTISLLLSDANGIDVVDDSIKMYLNGVIVPPENYVVSINPTSVNMIPIKYQINLSKGNYTLVVDCKDVNGNFNSREILFIVNDKFDIINVANYPNPVVGKAQDPRNDGRTRFTYVLTDDADDVKIKIYTVSGRLVKTFANLPTGVGYHEFPRTLYGWDCKDERDFLLANGVYFYKVIARKGNKTIERTQKMAILK